MLPSLGAGPFAVALSVIAWLPLAAGVESKNQTRALAATQNASVSASARAALARGVSDSPQTGTASPVWESSSTAAKGGPSAETGPRDGRLARLRIAVQPTEEEVAEVGEERGTETGNEEDSAAVAAPAAHHAGMQVAAVYQPRE